MKRRAGFTLIEILVVLFIVSIMTGIVVARLPRFSKTGDLDTEARRLQQLLGMAKQDALLEANEYGFKPEHTGYRFYIYDDAAQKWTPLADRPFQPRQLEDGIQLDAQVEDTDLKLGDSKNDKAVPPILLLSSGETTPFQLTLSLPAEHLSRTLVADGYGAFEWQDETGTQ
ncbi:MAG TPA: type II secretion system minor pseudopilin GspH [Pseudomonadales bacterium]|nr:type II secretion system minor pseudopilin GspH [Pseudomonadales bacterium]